MKKPIFKTILLKGESGNTISGISYKETNGRIETYTISLTDGSTFDYNVVNGNGIASIEKTSTSGYVDTYTITLDNGDTSTFTVTNGVTVDSTLSTSSENPVQNKVVASAINGLQDDTTTLNTRVATASATASNVQAQILPLIRDQGDDDVAIQRYIYGTYLTLNGKLYRATQTIQSGTTLVENTNIEETTILQDLSNRPQVYMTSVTKNIESVSSMGSTIISGALDLTDVFSSLGYGWYYEGSFCNARQSGLLITASRAIGTSVVDVTVFNSTGETITGITIDIFAVFYHPKLTF